MQPIPRHWATVSSPLDSRDGGPKHVTVTGSSDLSVQDAQRDARERMERLLAAGGPARRRGSDLGTQEYYPQRRTPEELLEELHDEGGTLAAAITRNRYGAAVLNTDALLISDIDLPEESARAARRAAKSGTGLLGRLVGGVRSHQAELSLGADGAEAEADDRGGRGTGRRGEVHDQVIAGIAEFTARHPELGVRTYRTRNGFRLLVTGADAAPASDRARDLLEELRSDELYVLLCRVHDSYRARLTPKPWRIGMDPFERLGTRIPTDPVHHEWVSRYWSASQEVAVCRLLSTSGPAPSDLERRIIELHDRATRPTSGLTLA